MGSKTVAGAGHVFSEEALLAIANAVRGEISDLGRVKGVVVRPVQNEGEVPLIVVMIKGTKENTARVIAGIGETLEGVPHEIWNVNKVDKIEKLGPYFVSSQMRA